MNKIILRVMGCVITGALFSPTVLAVVPYPISVESESQVSQESVADSTSPSRASLLIKKLGDDQRRLENVLQDIQEDQKALKQTDPKENSDGYSFH